MPDLDDLRRRIRQFKDDITTETVRKIAEDMHDETLRNFDAEAYTNDGGADPWPDRPFEKELGYKKLRYTGALKRSIKPMSRKTGRSGIAGVKSGVEYAKVHNEGGVSTAGNPIRKLTSGRMVSINTDGRIRQRKFMGVGSRTIAEAKVRIRETLRKYFSQR